MGHTTVRISTEAHRALREIATAEGRPMLALLDDAVEILRRRRFLESVNAAYASIRRNRAAWSAVEQERRLWDGTLQDGLAVREERAQYRRSKPTVRKRKVR